MSPVCGIFFIHPLYYARRELRKNHVKYFYFKNNRLLNLLRGGPERNCMLNGEGGVGEEGWGWLGGKAKSYFHDTPKWA